MGCKEKLHPRMHFVIQAENCFLKAPVAHLSDHGQITASGSRRMGHSVRRTTLMNASRHPGGTGGTMPTIREQMISLLSEGEYDAYELSQCMRIQEREVYPHLQHISKTLAARGRRLIIAPAACISCGFTFKNRARFKKPGRCPICRSERIRPPRYSIQG